MSAICIFNLKHHKLDFNRLDNLSKKLVRYSLCNNLGVFFNCYDYGADIIKDAEMKCFFLMSDSFLYKNCDDLLDTSFLTDPLDFSKYKKEFSNHFHFFNDILNIVFEYEVSQVEVYISEDGSTSAKSDFLSLQTTKDKFLETLLNSVLENADKYAFTFPDVNITVDIPHKIQ